MLAPLFPGHCPTLETFREMFGTFFMTREALKEACVVEIQHDTSMPKLKGMSMASRSDESESDD
jgi:hypothetical protein